VPMVACFAQAPEGAALLAEVPKLTRWWKRMAARPSFTASQAKRESD